MDRYYSNELYNRRLISLIFREFFIMLLLSTIGMVLGMMFVPPQLAFLASIGSFVILIAAAFTKRKTYKSLSRIGGLAVAFLMGISIFPTIYYYISTMGSFLVLVSLGITTVLFGGIALYSSTSKKDFTFLGASLFAGLFAMILISIVGFFIRSEVYQLALAWLGIIIFSGYVLYDVSVIKNSAITEDDVPSIALSLFLNFINIFIYMLRIVASFNRRD